MTFGDSWELNCDFLERALVNFFIIWPKDGAERGLFRCVFVFVIE